MDYNRTTLEPRENIITPYPFTYLVFCLSTRGNLIGKMALSRENDKKVPNIQSYIFIERDSHFQITQLIYRLDKDSAAD